MKTVKINDMTLLVEDSAEVVISGKTVTIKTAPPIWYYYQPPYNVPYIPYTYPWTNITCSSQENLG